MQKNNVWSILLIEEEIYRTVEVGRDVWRSPHPLSCLQQVLSEQPAQAVLQLASGNLQNGNSTVPLGDLLKINSCTLLLQFHLAIEGKKAIERNFIALKCCYVRYNTVCVSVNDVKGVLAFLSLQQTNGTYILGQRSFSM